ncbi:MAG TPA: TrkH family potassium uptake protein [bacterium]|nr:TrkH family potassium uptake protein [bacterium]
MRARLLVMVLGLLVILTGLVELVPAAVSYGYGESDWPALLRAALIAIVAGVVMFFGFRTQDEVRERDGFVIVSSGWCVVSLVGAIPFMMTGTTGSITDAIFESVSGFTTTGASILVDYSKLSHGILMWRSLTHWMGGMGILIFVLVILPSLGVGGMQLYKRESSGLSTEKLTPRLRDTAVALWSVYFLLTVAETLALWALGMTFFDAVNHAMATIATGGFGTHADSITGFHSPAIEWTIILFMYLGALNMALHYRVLHSRGRQWPHFSSEEWRFYTAILVVCSLGLAVYLIFKMDYAPFKALTKSTFQVVSIGSTTGFASDDYVPWGPGPQMIMLYLMIVGGCAGSTAGGLKEVRVLLLFKSIRMELLNLIHPRLSMLNKLDRQRVEPAVLKTIFVFFFLYMSTLGAASLILTLTGNSIPTALGGVASAMGGVGPGLDALGPSATYAPLPALDKWVLMAAMMLGRLELMTLYVFILPEMWRR